MFTLTVYILECSNGTYYTRVTNDIDRRVAEHNEGRKPSSFTFNKRPVKLVFAYDCIGGHEAHAIEKQIKGWRREKKKALIEGRWDDLPELSKRYSDIKNRVTQPTLQEIKIDLSEGNPRLI